MEVVINRRQYNFVLSSSFLPFIKANSGFKRKHNTLFCYVEKSSFWLCLSSISHLGWLSADRLFYIRLDIHSKFYFMSEVPAGSSRLHVFIALIRQLPGYMGERSLALHHSSIEPSHWRAFRESRSLATPVDSSHPSRWKYSQKKYRVYIRGYMIRKE